MQLEMINTEHREQCDRDMLDGTTECNSPSFQVRMQAHPTEHTHTHTQTVQFSTVPQVNLISIYLRPLQRKQLAERAHQMCGSFATTHREDETANTNAYRHTLTCTLIK